MWSFEPLPLVVCIEQLIDSLHASPFQTAVEPPR